jgi:hypothetical protein
VERWGGLGVGKGETTTPELDLGAEGAAAGFVPGASSLAPIQKRSTPMATATRGMNSSAEAARANTPSLSALSPGSCVARLLWRPQ